MKTSHKEITFKYASPKFKQLLKRKRFKLAYGGRGGAKSHSIARLLLKIGDKRKVRIVCAREVQNKIDESIKELFDNIISDNGLESIWHSEKTKIVNTRTGSKITFIGLQDHNSDQVKGLERCQIFWVDEANQLSARTFKNVIPTIRADKSEIWLSWNPYLPTDPIEEKFMSQEGRAQYKDRALYLYVDYEDNRFLSSDARIEAEECKKHNLEEYMHVWKGGYDKLGGLQLFPISLIEESQKRKIDAVGSYRIAGLDVAGSETGGDENIFAWRQGNEMLGIEALSKQQGKNLAHSTLVNEVVELVQRHKIDVLVIDAIGVGNGLDSFLKQKLGRSCKVVQFWGSERKQVDKKKYFNLRSETYFRFRDWMETGRILKKHEFVSNLIILPYDYDKNDLYVIAKKSEIKKDTGGKSPDWADAFMMTFYKNARPYEKVTSRPSQGMFLG